MNNTYQVDSVTPVAEPRTDAEAAGSTKPPYPIEPGEPRPFWTRPVEGGVNFVLFSRHASSVELMLYETADSLEPLQTVKLDPAMNRSFFFWHVLVREIPVGTHYAWRVDGPDHTAETGFRFNPRKELISPGATAVTDVLWSRAKGSNPDDSSRHSIRGVIADQRFDWAGDKPVAGSLAGAVIYEVHVGGFTRHPSSGVQHPGTFLGFIEKIPYLKALGITHVELLPVMAFDEQDVPPGVQQRGLKNYWGYSTHSFFSPHPRYGIAPAFGTHVAEFKTLVKALHAAGIGVILDVVFNHTAEGGAAGPTINFKGLANESFYHLDSTDRRLYRDYTGCGNTVNCNHPLVTAFILRCLEYWVEEMHVDGFRFDLASVFTRGEDGAPLANPPLPWNIAFSPALSETALIAEAWDAAGLYHVGSFPGMRWAEWNGRFRDVIRRFLRGDPGVIGEVATCVAGSSDLYADDNRLPFNGINFVTCHDGFTLHDLVSYNEKRNGANGEDNRDGCSNNLSWNCGVEGETDDADILSRRRRQAKNAMSVLLLSVGVPMLLSGDEVLRTQRGNNNAWCQDNELSWFDWTRIEQERDMLRFVSELIALRRRHPSLNRKAFLTGGIVSGRNLPDITWHGTELLAPSWRDPKALFLAYTLAGLDDSEEDLHVLLNMSDEAVQADLPLISGRVWYLAVDTSRAAPHDVIERSHQHIHDVNTHRVEPRSVVVFEARAR
jgi:glycogen operon protein